MANWTSMGKTRMLLSCRHMMLYLLKSRKGRGRGVILMANWTSMVKTQMLLSCRRIDARTAQE